MNRLSLEAAIGVTAVLALSQILPAGDLEPGPQPTILADEFTQAARDGDLTRARELIQRGIDIGCEDREGLTAIEAAQIAGQRGVQEYVVSLGADTQREPPPLKTWLSKWMFALTPEPSPGVAILVTQDGQVLFEDAQGLASMEQQIPVSLATRFRIASVTKQFTAAAILKLQEERKLSVRDPVAKYLPCMIIQVESKDSRHTWLGFRKSGCLLQFWQIAVQAGREWNRRP